MTTTARSHRDLYYDTLGVYSVRTGLLLGTFRMFLEGRTIWRDEDGNQKSARNEKVEVREKA